MATDQPEDTKPSAASQSPDPSRPEPPRTDATTLVDQMVKAGELPNPSLLKQILAAGDEAVEPLLAILRTNPRGRPDEAPLVNAAGLLSMLRPLRALPALVDLARRYRNETGTQTYQAIARFGGAGFDRLLEELQDSEIAGFRRDELISAAMQAAEDDPDRKERIAALLRQRIAELLESAQDEPEAAKQDRSNVEYVHQETTAHSVTSVTDDDLDNALAPEEEMAFLICHLCDIADPSAKDLIRAAFDKGRVDEAIVDWEDVEREYQSGGRDLKEKSTWLESYEMDYEDARKQAEFVARSFPTYTFPTKSSYPSFEPRVQDARYVPSTEPIKKTGPKIGRNDPCWCGSGKKFKKCHMGQNP